MKKTVLILFLMLFAASAVFGRSSRENRGDKIIFFGFTPVGIHIPSLLTQPLSVGFILGDSLEIGFEAGTWEGSDNDGGVTFTGEFSNKGVFLKWFPGNSFYISLSGHKREWTFTGTTILDDGTVASGTVETEATVVGIGIGNQWMFDFGLYIGVDWLMLSQATSETKTVTISDNITGTNRTEAEAEFNDAGDTLNDWSGLSGAVILTLGFAF